MASFIMAGKTGEFKNGEKKKVVIGGREIMLAKVDGRFYATDNLCPHLKGDLSAGRLEGTLISCPLQGSQFDIRDGRVLRWREHPVAGLTPEERLRPLKTYVVKTEDDSILVEIP